MPLGCTLKSYIYWGVIDLPHCSIAKHRGKTGEAPVLSAFVHQADPAFAIPVLMSPFLLSYLVNFFPQNVGCVVTVTTWVLPGHLYPLSGFSFLWSIWGKRNWFMSITKSLPLCTISLSHLRPLLSWLAITPTHSHLRRSLNQGDM